MTEGEEDDSDDDIEPIAEFRFVPGDKSACKCEWELCFTLKCPAYVWRTLGCRDVNTMIFQCPSLVT